MRKNSAITVVIVLILAAWSTAHADYPGTVIAYPVSAATNVYGINDSGTIVGDYNDGQNMCGFVLSNGNYTSLVYPDPNFVWTGATGINNAGTIVGWYGNGTADFGFVLSNGNYTSFGYPEGRNTRPNAINNAGTIVGSCSLISVPGKQYGFSLSGGTYTPLMYPDSDVWRTKPLGINDAGTIVGYYSSNSDHGFSLSGETYTRLDYPGAVSTQATGINDSGTIVGRYYTYENGWYAFTLSNGIYTSLGPQISCEPFGINDVGQMVGTCGTAGFLVTIDTSISGDFAPADLAGTWYFQMYGDSSQANAPYWASGTMILDSTGAVIGGTAVNNYGETKLFTDGSLTIDNAGLVTGSFTVEGGPTESLPHGKLDAGKTVLAMVSSDPNYSSLFMALKGGGNFIQADLAGTWYIQAISDQPAANNPYWVSGTMILDSTGAVIGGTAINSFGETKPFTSGSFTIDSLGQFSGSFLLYDGVTGSIPHGKLDAGKTTLIMVVSNSNNRGLFVAAKGGGTFTQADLAGTWYIQAIADQPAANNPYWASGTMILDSTGTVIGGTGVNSLGDNKPITSGSLTIDSLGQFSGNFLQPDGIIRSIPHGILDAGKTTLFMVESDPYNRGLFVALKGGMGGTCSGDIDSDGDVDGSDLAALITNTSLIDLTTFAQNFGENDCP
jgi:hypothetical protein